MLEQDSVHLVNARELLLDANEIAPTRAARVAVVGTGTGRGDDRISLLLSGLSGQIVLISRNKAFAQTHVDGRLQWRLHCYHGETIVRRRVNDRR
jgi:hypothetical protein